MRGSDSWLGEDYELLRILGRGANGWVALARHRPLNRLVAVKTVLGAELHGEGVHRIRREARILAQLRHPAIVTVYQLVARPDGLSIVMEYLPGGDLEQLLRKRQVGTAETLDVLSQVAGALSAAATVGVVHRDVKPANVLLDGQGRVVLADFGLARMSGASAMFRTDSGTLTGTPQFMAPEQIDNPARAAAPAIDAYAFGVLAYRLLTGGYPFSAETVAELYEAHRSSPPTPPQQVRAAFPPQAGRALLDALAKNPAQRPPPEQLVAVLTRIPAFDWAAVAPLALPGPETADTAIDPDDTSPGLEPVTAVKSAPGSAAISPNEPPKIRYPAVEQWVTPPVPDLPPARRPPVGRALLLTILGGLVLGIVVYLALMH